MDETARNSVQCAQIELAYAELELKLLGTLTPELRRVLDHVVAAKRHLCLPIYGSDQSDSKSGATRDTDFAATRTECC